uniref:Uncharacterized protein n=1 Tax=Lepeophtheirus salmonis TaxID=72036 RepID=A0A0K2TYW5_LEPSM
MQKISILLPEDIIETKSNNCMKLLQTDSGICSPKGSRSQTPLEEEKSRLHTILTTTKVMIC